MSVRVVEFHPEKCTGCLACEKACSKVHFGTGDGGDKSAIRISSEGGNYRASVCNQCGLCMDMCTVGALSRNAKKIVLIDQKECVGCQVCVGFCPRASMRKASDRIVPFKCISCGSCVRACPEKALELVDTKVDGLKAVVYHRLGA